MACIDPSPVTPPRAQLAETTDLHLPGNGHTQLTPSLSRCMADIGREHDKFRILSQQLHADLADLSAEV